MADWRKLFTDHFQANKEQDELTDLILGDGINENQIKDLFAPLGLLPPEEFVELYTQLNGVGHLPSSEQPWWFLPIGKLPEFFTQCRLWFADHPISNNYFPFIDFQNGESAGYVFNDNGTIHKGLCFYKIANYDDDEEQDWNEFLVTEFPDIESFVSECTGG